jgi:type III polyketide synthase
MAEEAANKALQDWGGSLNDITHMVVVTCTNTANPGLDYLLSQRLGLHRNVQRSLIHGIGCAGGVAALRTANELLLGRAALKKPGRALVVACEMTTIFLRTELAYIVSDDEVHIGPTLFGDGAGALILSNEIEIQPTESRSLWKILNVQSTTLEDSAGCLEFNVHAHGMIFLLSASLVSRRTSTLTTKQAITL